jgi:hypothetical protein
MHQGVQLDNLKRCIVQFRDLGLVMPANRASLAVEFENCGTKPFTIFTPPAATAVIDTTCEIFLKKARLLVNQVHDAASTG